jgi:transposase-like protein
MNCPKCNNTKTVKDGFMNSKQRFLCRKCNYHFTTQNTERGKPMELKRRALHLYLEGMGFNAISRVLKVSDVSVLKWIRKFGKEVEYLKDSTTVSTVEMDELYTFVDSKKTPAGYGSLLIDLKRGSLVLCVEIDQGRQV